MVVPLQGGKCVLCLQVKDERKAQEAFDLADYERSEELRKAKSRSKKNHSRFILLRCKRPGNAVSMTRQGASQQEGHLNTRPDSLQRVLACGWSAMLGHMISSEDVTLELDNIIILLFSLHISTQEVHVWRPCALIGGSPQGRWIRSEIGRACCFFLLWKV